MNDQYDIDDHCSFCEGNCDFVLRLVKGHNKKHRMTICRDCKREEIVTDCNCKGSC